MSTRRDPECGTNKGEAGRTSRLLHHPVPPQAKSPLPPGEGQGEGRPNRGLARGLWRSAALITLLFAASGARGQDAAPAGAPPVRLYVLADTVALGEAFEVAVAADRTSGVQALFPEVPRDRTAESGPLLALGDAEATALRRLPPLARGQARTDSVVYTALAFAADSARVGPLVVRLVSGTDTTVAESNAALVRVRRLTPGPDAPPRSGPGPFAFPSAAPVWTVLGVLAALVAALVGWGLWRALRKPRRVRQRPAALPYPEVAARLDALAARPPSPETAQAWFVELSDALRTYLRRRHGVATRERTTREIDRDLARALPPEARQALRGALRVADRVKFADLRPGPEASGDALARAREGVETAEAHARARAAEAARAPTGDGAAQPPPAAPGPDPPPPEASERDIPAG